MKTKEAVKDKLKKLEKGLKSYSKGKGSYLPRVWESMKAPIDAQIEILKWVLSK